MDATGQQSTDRRRKSPHMSEGGGSNPSLGTKLFRWLMTGEPVGLPECPYLRRWVIDFGKFSLRLHRWQSSDDDRAFHDHPWWFFTVVLFGGYDDFSSDGVDRMRFGSIRFRPALHRHTVKVRRPGTWTLLVTGPVSRRWGFWIGEKSKKRDKYFAQNGHHPCSPGGTPVRMLPNGERL